MIECTISDIIIAQSLPLNKNSLPKNQNQHGGRLLTVGNIEANMQYWSCQWGSSAFLRGLSMISGGKNKQILLDLLNNFIFFLLQ